MFVRFRDNSSGNVAMLAALMVVLLFVLGGGAVDFIRLATVRSELQSATDSAVLAAASLTNNQSPIVVANDYFDKNFDGSKFQLTNVVFTPQIEQNTPLLRSVSATVSADMPTFFLGILDKVNGGGVNSFKTLTINVASKASESEQFVEIAVVLDISGSMSGTKITNLRDAGEAFINKVFDEAKPGQTSMSIIPFSSNVNIDPILDDVADTSTISLPAVKPCALYEDDDLDSDRLTVLRPVVDEFAGDARNRCAATPIFLNSGNRSDLVTAVQALTPGGRTDAHLGLMWGAKALSPSMRGYVGGDFGGRPADYTNKTIKSLIVMTDGIMNPIPDPDTTIPLAEATAQFGTMCDEAKANGIIVFAIGFDITAGSPPDIMLSACASTLSQYYLVEGLDIASAFDGIAASISALRVTD